MKIDMFFNHDLQIIRKKIENMSPVSCLEETLRYIFKDDKDASEAEKELLGLLKDDYINLLDKLYRFKYKNYTCEELLNLYMEAIMEGYGAHNICELDGNDLLCEVDGQFDDCDILPIIKDFFFEKIDLLEKKSVIKTDEYYKNIIKSLEGDINELKSRIKNREQDIEEIKNKMNGGNRNE